ncbi:MAG: anaerobic ribonucleoside-triphosphate reductase activating protein [Syntrophotaleaceae bacterium]
MGIKGFQGTSLLDFPGRIASLVFYGGCNLTCPYCHNPSLVLTPDELDDYPVPALVEDLARRRTFIDGVVVSGGEPTIDKGLLPLLSQIKALGLLVKLDTNGLEPKVLKEAIWEGLVDFVAIDLKTSPARYQELHPGKVDIARLAKSVRLLLDSPVDYEFRTTCVPTLVGQPEIRDLGEMIRGAHRWVLQQFVPQHSLAQSAREIPPCSAEELGLLAETARQYVDEVALRGL